MKYKVKLITYSGYREQVKDYGYYPKFGKPEYRYVPFIIPEVVIFGDNLLFITYRENPIVIIITSKELAEAYRTFFKEMWKIGKK